MISALKSREDQDAELAKEIIGDFESLKSEKANFEAQCRDVAELILPTQKNQFQSSLAGSVGEERNDNMFDATGSIALSRFVNIVDSLVSPRNQRYHFLRTNNKELEKRREVRLFFDEATDAVFRYRYSPRANFSPQNYGVYESYGGFGNGVMFTDALETEPGLRYKSCSFGHLYWKENHQGIVDHVIRHFCLKAFQAVQLFKEKTPAKIKEANEKTPMREFEFLHCVKPNQKISPIRKDYRGMKYSSYYVAIEGKALVREGGYRTFPYSIAKYKQAPGEVYARSIAMECLPSLRVLNMQKQVVLKQGHRTVDPVLLAYDDGMVGRFSLRPGALNVGGVTRDGRPLVQTLPIGNVMIGKELMDDERKDINDAYLISLFQILVDSPMKTATEVVELAREKGILIAPAFIRLEEYWGSLVEREVDVLAQQGLLPPMPPVLQEAQGEYTIQYDSPFSRSQKMEEIAGVMQTFDWISDVSAKTQRPEYMDYFDGDNAIPEIMKQRGIPERWITDPKKLQVLRKMRQDQMDAQMAAQLGPSEAAIMKSAAVAKEKAPEVLDAVMGG